MKFFISIMVYLFLLLMQYSCRQENHSGDKLSVRVSKDFIRRFPDPDSIHWVGQSNHFSWQAGYIMFAMEKMWDATGDSVYFRYIKRYVDQQVDESGNVPDFKNTALDNFLPGYAILYMYEQTGLEKYKMAATQVFNGFRDYPRACNGLFLHSSEDWAKNQVWVDGVFMGQIFLARYGSLIGERDYAYTEVVSQMTKILEKCQKPNGLLLHGWTDDRYVAWADYKTGLSPEVWSEGLGWFAVLIADIFDYLPPDHPGVHNLSISLHQLCDGLAEVQDSTTGMWCQVVDKPYQEGNWNETSGTAMFIYLLQKSVEKGYILAQDFQPVINKAYAGLSKKIVMNERGFYDLQDCSSIGIMNSYSEYVSQPRETSTFAAFGSVILGLSAFEF